MKRVSEKLREEGESGKRKSVASDWITVRESPWTHQMTGTNCPLPSGILIYPAAILSFTCLPRSRKWPSHTLSFRLI